MQWLSNVPWAAIGITLGAGLMLAQTGLLVFLVSTRRRRRKKYYPTPTSDDDDQADPGTQVQQLPPGVTPQQWQRAQWKAAMYQKHYANRGR